MHPDLEVIVSADEEARSRVALEQERRERELTAARGHRDAAIRERRQDANDTLERELQIIRADGEARVDDLQRQQTEYLARLADTGKQKSDEAVALYLRIVCEASP